MPESYRAGVTLRARSVNRRKMRHARNCCQAWPTRAFMLQNRAMKWLGMVCLLSAIACTKPNPRSCADGICNDQNYPFCDSDGTLGGEPNECIAVQCTPNEFESCRGDQELRCNATGNDYETTKCELGCGVETDGCKLCEPNETSCTNGKVATCDANGAIVSTAECALGCFEDQPRCRDIVPSNGLAAYLDQIQLPPDVDLSGGGVINTTSGTVSNTTSQVLVPTFLIPASADAPQLRVLVVNDILLGDVMVKSDAAEGSAGPALAIVANGEIAIVGHVKVRTGDVVTGACVGGLARVTVDETDPQSPRASGSGSGGGGNATTGGAGGSAPQSTGGTAGLVTAANSALVPLRGGCASGGANENGLPSILIGVRGGGAIQLSSRSRIRVDGVLDANGTTGASMQTTTSGVGASIGGGSGGGLLLEAPVVSVGAAGALLVKGGDGFGCVPGGNEICSAGEVTYGTPGVGAMRTSVATSGGPTTTALGAGGGGGGGLGRIRVNAPNGAFTSSNTSTVEGDLTSGILRTR